jgi:survival of motor neuron-related-splicing factor 30
LCSSYSRFVFRKKMNEEEELIEYERQLAEVNDKLAETPDDEELLSLKTELVEIIELTRSLLDEQKAERKPHLAPPPPPPPSSHVGISQAAKRYINSEVTELSGWRVGDRCRTVFLDDGQKYSAIVSTLKPETKSAVVTFVKYLNQQDTPIVFLERVVEVEAVVAAAAAAAGEVKGGDKKDGKRQIVIKATDAPEVVERKKRLLKKQKREVRTAEKDKERTTKINSWQSFQTASASRPPASAAAVLVAASKSKNVGEAGAPSESARGVRTRWDRGSKDQQQDE